MVEWISNLATITVLVWALAVHDGWLPRAEDALTVLDPGTGLASSQGNKETTKGLVQESKQ